MKYIGPKTLLLRLLTAGLGKEPKLRPRLLGVDFGKKYTGISVTDPHNRYGLPLTVLEMRKEDINQQAEQMQQQIEKWNVYGIVFGYPLGEGKRVNGKFVGKETERGVNAVEWVDQLDATKELGNIEYTYWSERFTTQSIEERLSDKIIPDLRVPAVNQHASALIVESLLAKLLHIRVAWENGEKVDVREDE